MSELIRSRSPHRNLKKNYIWKSHSFNKLKATILGALFTNLYRIAGDNLIIVDYGKFIFKHLVDAFIPPRVAQISHVKAFARFFYKNIRDLQSFIRSLKFKITGMYNLKLLKFVSSEVFDISFRSISFFSEHITFKAFDEHVRLLYINDNSSYIYYLKIVKFYGIKFDFPSNYTYNLNLYLFQFYIRLHELEEILQWFN